MLSVQFIHTLTYIRSHTHAHVDTRARSHTHTHTHKKKKKKKKHHTEENTPKKWRKRGEFQYAHFFLNINFKKDM